MVGGTGLKDLCKRRLFPVNTNCHDLQRKFYYAMPRAKHSRNLSYAIFRELSNCFIVKGSLFLAPMELKKCKLLYVRTRSYFDFCVMKGRDADVRV